MTKFFRQITECMRSGYFLQKLQNYYIGQRKRIQVGVKGPPLIFQSARFRRKTQTIVVTFFKTNELTDFIRFIS